MAGQQILVIFALAATAQADNCAAMSAYYQLEANLTGKYCTSSDTSYSKKSSSATSKTTYCGSCCTMKNGTCYKLAYTGTGCATPTTHQVTEANLGKAATTANFDATCCTEKPKCSAFTCPAAYDAKTDKATKTCSGTACDKNDCCTLKTLTCGGSMSKAMTDSKSCDTATQYWDSSKGETTVKADLTDYKTNCCTNKKKCDATCSAGYKDKATKATIDCAGSTCSTSECCDVDPLKCFSQKYTIGVANGCTTKTQFADPAKYGTAFVDAANYKANCCTDTATCATFKAATNVVTGSTSAATPQAAAKALLPIVVGALAMGQ